MHSLRRKRKIYIQLEAETPPGPFDFLMALGFSPGKKPYFALTEVGKFVKVLRDIPRHHKSVLRYPCCVRRLSIISLNQLTYKLFTCCSIKGRNIIDAVETFQLFYCNQEFVTLWPWSGKLMYRKSSHGIPVWLSKNKAFRLNFKKIN